MSIQNFRTLFAATFGLCATLAPGLAPSLAAADSTPACWPISAKQFSDLGCGADTPYVCTYYSPDRCSDTKKYSQRIFQCVASAATCKSAGADVTGLTPSARASIASSGNGGGSGGLNARAMDTSTAGTAATAPAAGTPAPAAQTPAPVAANPPPANPAGQTYANVLINGANVGIPVNGTTTNTPANPPATTAGNTAGANPQTPANGATGNPANPQTPATQPPPAPTSVSKAAPDAPTSDPDVLPGTGAQGNSAQDSSNTANNTGTAKTETQLNDNITKAGNSNTYGGSSTGCDKSASLQYGCAGTKNIVQAAQITNQVGQVAGSMVVGQTGSSAQEQALANGGTTADALLAAAQTQKTAAELQLGLGATNAMLGVLQLAKGSAASHNAQTLGSHFNNPSYYKAANGQITTSGDRIAGLVKNADGNAFSSINSAYQKAYQTDQADAAANPLLASQVEANEKTASENAQTAATRAAQVYATGAATEQRAVADVANAGGLTSLVAAAQQLAQGYFNYKGAEQMKAAAEQLASDNAGAGILTPPAADNFPGTSTGALGATTITGNGVAANTAAVTGSSGGVGGGDLGPPVPGDPNAGTVAPGGTPAPWNPSAGGTGGGAPGGASLGGGSTAAASPDNTPTNPTAASNNTGTQYSGTDARPGGSGNSGNGFATGTGLDLEKIAGMFKKDEGDKTPTGADFHGQGGFRELASDNSVLGPDANLFRNVHERYNTIQSEKRL